MALPTWLVKGPAIVTCILIAVAIVDMIAGNYAGKNWTLAPGIFLDVVTFCVTLLNATTLIIVGKYFEST